MTGAGECDRTWEGEITWSAIMWHVQDNQDIRASPHGLMVLANLISFYDKVSSLVDQRMAGDVAYQHFRKDSGSFPQHLSWRNCLWLSLSCPGETKGAFAGWEPEHHHQPSTGALVL